MFRLSTARARAMAARAMCLTTDGSGPPPSHRHVPKSIPPCTKTNGAHSMWLLLTQTLQ